MWLQIEPDEARVRNAMSRAVAHRKCTRRIEEAKHTNRERYVNRRF